MNRLTKIKIIFNLTLLLTAIVGEIRFAWFLRRDPLNALNVVCPYLTKMVTWMKLICFLIYRKDLGHILKCLFEHCQKDANTSTKRNMISKVSYFASVWCIVVYVNAFSTSILFAAKPLIIWSYQFLVNGNKDSWVSLPFQVALPYQDMTLINNKTLYSIIYCFLAHSGTITIFGISGTDGTFFCFCMYISVSYQCLQEDFKTAFKKHTSKDLDSSSQEIFYKELTQLIRRQQNIIEIFKSFNRIYKFMIFIHFASASIILAIVLANLLLISGISKLIYLTYAFGAGIQLFTYCYGAEYVTKNCVKLSEVLYFCDWYKCNRRVKLLILFTLIKSQRGSPLRAPFFQPSLQLFALIIQRSGSYLTILQAVL
uniref:Odorant receptor n=1 Tax=Scaeva pyrastri TaxID=219539 RepID=A0A1B3B776_SCAPY|nr:putative odorant receptor OR1 [Scaeva pyrastri]